MKIFEEITRVGIIMLPVILINIFLLDGFFIWQMLVIDILISMPISIIYDKCHLNFRENTGVIV